MEYFLQMLQTISVADPKRLQSDSNPTLHFYSDPEPDPDSKFKKTKTFKLKFVHRNILIYKI